MWTRAAAWHAVSGVSPVIITSCGFKDVALASVTQIETLVLIIECSLYWDVQPITPILFLVIISC